MDIDEDDENDDWEIMHGDDGDEDDQPVADRFERREELVDEIELEDAEIDLDAWEVRLYGCMYVYPSSHCPEQLGLLPPPSHHASSNQELPSISIPPPSESSSSSCPSSS